MELFRDKNCCYVVSASLNQYSTHWTQPPTCAAFHWHWCFPSTIIESKYHRTIKYLLRSLILIKVSTKSPKASQWLWYPTFNSAIMAAPCVEMSSQLLSAFINPQFLNSGRPYSPDCTMSANIDSWLSSCSLIDIFQRNSSMTSNLSYGSRWELH